MLEEKEYKFPIDVLQKQIKILQDMIDMNLYTTENHAVDDIRARQIQQLKKSVYILTRYEY